MGAQMKTWADLGISIRAGSGETDTQCPWCSSQRKKKQAKCLSVNLDKGTYFCHHCGASGGLQESHKSPAELHWRKPRYTRPERRTIPDGMDADMVDFFKARGITTEVLQRNLISLQTVWMPQVEDRVKAVCFPYLRGDEWVNAKYRDREKNFRMEAGAERILYGLNDIDAKRCVIVEGEIDKLSVEVAGIRSCVSVPDGAPSANAKDYASKFAFLEADKELIESVTQWVIAVDGDAPGQRLEDELSRRLGREKCKRVVWPEGVKDANEMLLRYGSHSLGKLIDAAQPFPLAGVFEIEDLSDRIDQLYENGWEKGRSTGWDEVDHCYSVRPGELTVVTGIPNSGKSNWVDSLATNLANLHGWRGAFFSPENQPLEDHMARMVEKYARIPFEDGPSPRMDRNQLRDGKAWVQDHFFWILPDDDTEWTIDTVLDRAKSLVFRKGITFLVIDPWNELEHNRPQGMNETDYVGIALKKMRQFARRNGIHLFVVVHPTKLYRDKDGKYPVPTLYDCSGSAHWRNKADNGICVWRDFTDDDGLVQVHVQKIRFRQIGKIGLAQLQYIKPIACYSDPSFSDPRMSHNRSKYEAIK